MHSKEDLIQAKDVLSARYLATAVRNNVMARRFTTNMREAVVNVGANVHAIGVGRKVVEGVATSELAVKIYVVQKFAESVIPPRNLLPKELNGITCDVIESPPAFIQPRARKASAKATPAGKATVAPPVNVAAVACTDKRRERQRAFGAGISVAHRDVTAGTLGYFCRSTRPGDSPDDVFILSNNHVLANVNRGARGDEIFQPGPADGGTDDDLIAQLQRFVTINLGGSLPNRVDAAIAKVVPNVEPNFNICSIGRVNGTDRGVEDMRVRKHGRTSGLTEGLITAEAVDALVGMDHNDPSVVALFKNQLHIDRTGSSLVFGLGGDSGSLVVAGNNQRAVGLYFAGPENGVYGLASHISDVLEQLSIDLIV